MKKGPTRDDYKYALIKNLKQQGILQTQRVANIMMLVDRG